MSEHRAEVAWQRSTPGFTPREYSRDHAWSFPGGVQVPASAAALYRGSAGRVNPEESFVAALASCHLLSFLFVCAQAGLVVDEYRDQAAGRLEQGPDGRMWVARVVLSPRVRFADGVPVSEEQHLELHRQAHTGCFIAASVKSEVVLRPSLEGR